MKSKTSITLSKEILEAVDRMVGPDGNRSAFIELALRKAIAIIERERRDARDMNIINRNAERINREANDVLSYQVDT